jgi:hypothetical protein
MKKTIASILISLIALPYQFIVAIFPSIVAIALVDSISPIASIYATGIPGTTATIDTQIRVLYDGRPTS